MSGVTSVRVSYLKSDLLLRKICGLGTLSSGTRSGDGTENGMGRWVTHTHVPASESPLFHGQSGVGPTGRYGGLSGGRETSK